MTRLIAFASSGPAFSELSLAEQLQASIEATATGGRFYTPTQAELDWFALVHEQLDEHMSRPQLTEAGREVSCG